jgi:putative hemolysin
MKKLSGQSGFTVVEGLLILLLVGIIGGTGYYVWHANKSANKNLSNANVSATTLTKDNKLVKTYADCMKRGGQEKLPENGHDVCVMPNGKKFTSPAQEKQHSYTTTTPDTSGGYFVIKEWDVRAKYSGSLTLQYTFDGTNKDYAIASFGSTQLAGVVKGECTTEQGAAGYIERGKPTDHYINPVGDDSGKTLAQKADEVKTSQFPYLKQVGGYVYSIAQSPEKCAEPVAADDLQLQTRKAVYAIFTNLEAVPSH